MEETDLQDRASQGIYEENLKRMAKKKGTDSAEIDSSLTYGENKAAMGLKTEREANRGTGKYAEEARMEAAWKRSQAKETEDMGGVEGIEYMNAEDASELKNKRTMREAGSEYKNPMPKEVEYFSPSEVKSHRRIDAAKEKVGGFTQTVMSKSMQTAKAMAGGVKARAVQRQERGGGFAEERQYGRRQPQQGGGMLEAALNDRGGGGALEQALSGRGGGNMFGSSGGGLDSILGGRAQKQPKQRYAVIVEGNTVRRIPVQDMQGQQMDPLQAMLQGSGQGFQAQEPSHRGSRQQEQGGLRGILEGASGGLQALLGGESGGRRHLSEGKGGGGLSALLSGKGGSGLDRLLGGKATNKNPILGNSSMGKLFGRRRR